MILTILLLKNNVKNWTHTHGLKYSRKSSRTNQCPPPPTSVSYCALSWRYCWSANWAAYSLYRGCSMGDPEIDLAIQVKVQLSTQQRQVCSLKPLKTKGGLLSKCGSCFWSQKIARDGMSWVWQKNLSLTIHDDGFFNCKLAVQE